MREVEKYENIAQIAKAYGLSVEFVTAACKRKSGNVLRCINAKRTEKGRDYFLIRQSEFDAWLDREESGRVA